MQSKSYDKTPFKNIKINANLEYRIYNLRGKWTI